MAEREGGHLHRGTELAPERAAAAGNLGWDATLFKETTPEEDAIQTPSLLFKSPLRCIVVIRRASPDAHGEGTLSEVYLVNPFLPPRTSRRPNGLNGRTFRPELRDKEHIAPQGRCSEQTARPRARDAAPPPPTYLEYHRKSDQIELGKTRDSWCASLCTQSEGAGTQLESHRRGEEVFSDQS